MRRDTYTRLRKARLLRKEREQAMLQRRHLGELLRAELDAMTPQQRAAWRLRKERAGLRKAPPGPDPYLTLAELALRYCISFSEARRRVHDGRLPCPVNRDGRDSKHRRWSRKSLDAFDAWQKSRARLAKRKFSLAALQALRKQGRTGTVLKFERRKPT